MLARSSKRALSSTRQTACLPRSAARISAGTSGESSLVRYTVCLIASTSGSLTASSTSRSTELENESYGWCRRMSLSRIAAITFGSSDSRASSPGWVSGVHGSSRSSL
jgi:hypothetical protein